MNFDAPILFAFCGYLVATLLIGFVAFKATHSLSDYILGGRQMGPAVTALSVGASDMSGWLLLGLPGAIYLSGLSELWISFGLVIGAYLNWRLVAAKLRVKSEQNNALTLPSFFASLFTEHSFTKQSGVNKALRVIPAVIIILFFTFYVSSGLVGGALLFQQVFELDYLTALIVGTVVIVSYTLVGGFFAVSWTDFFQGCMMLLALLVLPIVGIVELGGLNATLQTMASKPGYLDLFHQFSLLGVISLMAWGLGYFGQPHILARFMAIKSEQELPMARRIAMSWMILALIGAVMVGLVGHAVFAETQLNNPETVFIFLSQVLLNPWVAGLLIAAILSAIMSTIDSQLLVSSSVIIEDVIKPILGDSTNDQQMMMLSRVMVGAVAVVALLLALSPDNSVLGLVSYAWAGFGASFGPIILLALYWQGLTAKGALAGMIAGALTVIAWKQQSGGLFDLYEIVPGFIMAGLVAIFLSKLVQPKQEK